MTTTLDPTLSLSPVSLPPQLDEMRGDERTFVEHAAIPNRIPNSAFGLVVEWARRPSCRDLHALVITYRPEFFTGLLRTWFSKTKLANITVMDQRRFDFHSVDPEFLKFVCLPDSHRIPDDLGNQLCKHAIACRARLLCSGVFCESSHWFYQWARKDASSLLRFDASSLLEIYPALDHTIRTERAELGSLAARLLDLQDTQPDRFSLRTFARKRVYIRTDKPKHVLSKTQQEIAKTQLGVPVVPMHLTSLQQTYLAKKRLSRMKGKPQRYLLLKYRRGGFTTLEQTASYKVWCTEPRSQVVTLAHTMSSTRRIFRMVSLMHESDPRSPILASDSKSQLESADNGALFFIGTAGSTGFGRGDTLQRVHGSEVSKWCHQDVERVSDLVAGLTEAASQGEVVLETTPDGIEWFATTYKEAKAGYNDWTPLFLAWFNDPINRLTQSEFDPDEIRDTLDEKEKTLIELHGLDLAQIAFRRSKKRELKKLFPQEYPEDDESCFLLSGTPFFDVELIISLIEKVSLIMKRDPDFERRRSVPGGYEIRWEDPIPGHEYVAGADTSEGLPGCDRNGVGVLHKDSGRMVATVHGLFDPRTLANHAVRLSKEYNEALLGVERENHGHAVLQQIVNLGYGKPHYKGGSLFYHSKSKGGQDLDKVSKAGWTTNAITRPVMLDALCDYVDADGAEERIRDIEFLNECTTFRKQSNGRWDHDPGCYDDTLFKWGIAHQMRNYRKRKAKILLTDRR